MKKILLTVKIPDENLTNLKDRFEFVTSGTDMTLEQIKKYVGIVDGIVSSPAGLVKDVLELAGANLKVIGTTSVGYDHIDIPYCNQKKLAVVNTPREVTHPTSEITIALILDVMRRISYYDRQLRKTLKCDTPAMPDGMDSLFGKTLGIVGFGRIGQVVAHKLKAFGMKVLYTDIVRATPEIEAECNARHVSLEALLRQADVVSLHCPYTEENHHIIDAEAFAMMKPSSYFINTARGNLVDEKALIEVLKNGGITGAGLDVYENEPLVSPVLAQLDNVVILPHIGTLTYNSRMRMRLEALSGVVAVLNGEIPYNIVNKGVLERS